MTMTRDDVPGLPEAVAALTVRFGESSATEQELHDIVLTVLTAAMPSILIASFADLADAILEDGAWQDGPVCAAYLDTVSNQIRERTQT